MCELFFQFRDCLYKFQLPVGFVYLQELVLHLHQLLV